MATREELKRFTDETDVRTLEEAVRIIKRRKVRSPHISQVDLCRLLTGEAGRIRRALIASRED